MAAQLCMCFSFRKPTTMRPGSIPFLDRTSVLLVLFVDGMITFLGLEHKLSNSPHGHHRQSFEILTPPVTWSEKIGPVSRPPGCL